MRTPRAFTLIELLFVVAVIAVLAAISVPNFLEAQIRSKTARTRIDMAALASSLRAYYADHNRYPPNNPEVADFLQAAAQVEQVNAQTLPTPQEAPYSWTQDDAGADKRPGNLKLAPGKYADPAPYPVLRTAGHDLARLTTPVAYYNVMLPEDVFHRSEEREPYLYLNLADVSTTSPMIGGGRLRRFLLLSYGPDQRLLNPGVSNPVKGAFLPYDPTNGTVSHGDILEFGDWASEMRPGDAPEGLQEKPGTTGFGQQEMII